MFRDVDPGDERLEVDDLEQFSPRIDLVPRTNEPLGDGSTDRRANSRVPEFPLGVLDLDASLFEMNSRSVVSPFSLRLSWRCHSRSA